MSISAEEQILFDLVQWHRQAAAIRAFTGAASEEEVAARIIEVDGPDPVQPIPDQAPVPLAFVVIDFPVLRIQRTAGAGYAGTADVQLDYVMPIDDSDTEVEIYRRAAQHLAAIRRELLAAFEGRILSVSVEPAPTLLPASSSAAACVEFGLGLTLEVVP